MGRGQRRNELECPGMSKTNDKGRGCKDRRFTTGRCMGNALPWGRNINSSACNEKRIATEIWRFICHFTFIQNCARIKKVVSCTKLNFPTNNRDASVAQWIERCPPEACAAVRLRSDAIGYIG